MPDDELLKVAESGRLNDPTVLEGEVRRMLADPRAQTLATNFAYQWLQLGDLDQIVPDPKVFPAADARDEMVREVELFVESVFREDRNVVDLMTADYTYLNERLAVHYGIRGVKGDSFRRVHLENPVRRGLLGKGAVLMVSSYPDRTSPVRRGAWILENITGTPPVPPPPDVWRCSRTTKLAPRCSRPSARGWRSTVARRAAFSATASWIRWDSLWKTLMPSGAGEPWRCSRERRSIRRAAFPDGTKLAGPEDLRAALMRNPEQFVQTLTEKLMTYGLGRRLEYYDMPTVQDRAHVGR